MTDRDDITRGQIEAYVDGQLGPVERARVLLALEDSAALRDQVAELRRLRDLLRLAYDEPPRPRAAPHERRGRGHFMRGAVTGAAAALALAALAVWSLAPGPGASRNTPGAVPAAGTPERLMFHITSEDPTAAAELLDQVELVAGEFRRRGRALRLVVIANHRGLQLYRAGNSAHVARVRELFERFDNVIFAACGSSLQRLRETGESWPLIPEAMVIDSGVAEIARRQERGWKYIRI